MSLPITGLFSQPAHSAHEMASTVSFSHVFQEPPGSNEGLHQSKALSEVPQSKRDYFLLLKAAANAVMFVRVAVNRMIDTDSGSHGPWSLTTHPR